MLDTCMATVLGLMNNASAIWSVGAAPGDQHKRLPLARSEAMLTGPARAASRLAALPRRGLVWRRPRRAKLRARSNDHSPLRVKGMS